MRDSVTSYFSYSRMIYALFILIFFMSNYCLATEGTDLLSAADVHYKKTEFLKAHRKVDEAITKLGTESVSNTSLKKDLSRAHFLKAEIMSSQQVGTAKIKLELMEAITSDPQYIGTINTKSLKPDLQESLAEAKAEFIEKMQRILFGQAPMMKTTPSPIVQATRIEPSQPAQQRHTMAIIPIILKDAYKDEPPRSINESIMKQIPPILTSSIKHANAYIVPDDKANILKAQLAIRDYDQFVMGPDKPVGMDDIEGRDVNTGDIFSKIGFVSLPEPYILKFNPLYKHLNADSILLVSVYNNLSFSKPYFIQVYYCFYTKHEKSKPTLRDSIILENPSEIIPFIKRIVSKFDAYIKSLE